ncbi:DUF3104 domain-containing protein [Synechococcus sp. UW179A]|nr:DUF3104 domain-containing protein [Synechococcus sp. UW179A]
MGQVIHRGGVALDPKAHDFFKIAYVDSSKIRWGNVDLVTHILPCDPGK